MKYSEQSRDYSLKYAKEKLKRVPLDLTKEKYAEVQEAAKMTGESINGFIKRLIDDELIRMKGDTAGGFSISDHPEE